MFYTFYCHGLVDQPVDWKDLRGDNATAYAIGSLDRLHRVKLPRCRKEVEDAIAALSDPKNCGNNLVCAGFATQSETPSAAQQWQERCNRLQAERDNYHSLLDAAEDARKRADMPIVVDGDALTQMKKDYIQAFGADNYGMLRQHIDAHTRRVDGSLDADLATLIHFTTMKYHIANKAK